MQASTMLKLNHMKVGFFVSQVAALMEGEYLTDISLEGNGIGNEGATLLAVNLASNTMCVALFAHSLPGLSPQIRHNWLALLPIYL